MPCPPQTALHPQQSIVPPPQPVPQSPQTALNPLLLPVIAKMGQLKAQMAKIENELNVMRANQSTAFLLGNQSNAALGGQAEMLQ